MPRVRISTTVDGSRLEEARRRVGRPDSELIDQALALLVRDLDEQRDLAALAAATEDDPDLPYEGGVPPEVLRLVAERRASYRLS